MGVGSSAALNRSTRMNGSSWVRGAEMGSVEGITGGPLTVPMSLEALHLYGPPTADDYDRIGECLQRVAMHYATRFKCDEIARTENALREFQFMRPCWRS